MELKRSGKFIVDYYGGLPYLPGNKVVLNWLDDQSDKLLNPRFKELKSAINNETELEKMLKVFNMDENGVPVIPAHQLFECSRNAHKLAGAWKKYGVSADLWKDSIIFQPMQNYLYNGKIIDKPHGVEVYTVTTKVAGKRVSFFSAYQYIKAGSTFTIRIIFPDDLIEKVSGKGENKIFEPDTDKTIECVNSVLDKMGAVGLGAFRARFGKFEWV